MDHLFLPTTKRVVFLSKKALALALAYLLLGEELLVLHLRLPLQRLHGSHQLGLGPG